MLLTSKKGLAHRLALPVGLFCLVEGHVICAALKVGLIILHLIILPAADGADFKDAIRREAFLPTAGAALIF